MLKAPDTVAVTATPQRVELPQGVGAQRSGWTLRNEDASNSIYYVYDPQTYAGDVSDFAGASDSVLRGLGAGRIEPKDRVFIGNSTPWLAVVCITAGTASLNVEPGLVDSDNDAVIEASTDAIQKSVTASTSVLYDGGDTANAMRDTIATSTEPASAVVIEVGANNILELFVTNASAAETITVNVAEYSVGGGGIATLIRNVPVAMGADQARTVDRACVGLTTGTEHYCKAPVRVAVTPGSFIQLSIVENVTGPNYCRYMLKGAL